MSLAVENNNHGEIDMNFRPHLLDIRKDAPMKKFSVTELPGICNELDRIINYLKNSTNVEYLLYDYPEILENQLKENVVELEAMLKEIKSVNSNIQQQKQQQGLISKEKSSLKKVLRKLKDNEIREMETVISLFDKAMFVRWETVKSTRKPETLERFLSDVMSKQLALDNLNILASRKLTNLQKFPKGQCVTSPRKIESNLPISSIENNQLAMAKIPPPPPLPDFPTWAITNFINSTCQPPVMEDSIRIDSIQELD